MNGGGGKGGQKRRGSRKSRRADPAVHAAIPTPTETKGDDLGDDGGAPGRGGHARITPDRSTARARRATRGRAPSRSPRNPRSDSSAPGAPRGLRRGDSVSLAEHEMRLLQSGGRRSPYFGSIYHVCNNICKHRECCINKIWWKSWQVLCCLGKMVLICYQTFTSENYNFKRFNPSCHHERNYDPKLLAVLSWPILMSYSSKPSPSQCSYQL